MSNNVSQLGNKIQQAKSNVQKVLSQTSRNFSQSMQRTGRNVKNTFQRASSNTRNLQNSLNRSIQRVQRSASTDSPSNLNYFLLGLLFIFLMLLLVMIVYYLITDCKEKKSLTDFIFDTRNPMNPCIAEIPVSGKGDQTIVPASFEIPGVEEVFHISNQDYTYDQSKCKCKAYGARLATEAEIRQAYNNGADWCSYGWSQGQRAFFPTQQTSYQKLAKKHRFDCGRPGINGGFFSNPNLKFGVNCYGIKPAGKVVPLNKPNKNEFCARRNNFQADQVLETDEIAPFNEMTWNS